MIAGVILAAGASRRMGTPKALLDYCGETFLDRLIGALGAACDPLVVVLGHHEETIRAGLKRRALFVRNPDPDRGQITSLQTGLAAVPPQAEGVLFTPVDYPAIEPATIRRLARAFDGDRIVQPTYKGRRGHPVVVARGIIAELLALPATATAREVLQRHPAQYVEVDDPGVITDIDEPADYARLVGQRV